VSTKPKPFEAVLTQEQRDTVARARADYRLPGPDIVRRAAAGELKTPEGKVLEPFTVTPEYARSLGAALVRERMGRKTTALSQVPPRDAVEALRIRLVNLADSAVNALERQRPAKLDLQRMDQAAKLVTTIARIPGPKEPPPANPESKGPDRPGRVSPGTTAGGLMRGTLGKAHTSSAGARTNQSGEDPGVSGNGDGPHDGGPSDEA
jgi:hypothetical protein